MMESDTAHELVRVAGSGRLDTLKRLRDAGARLRDAGADAHGVGKLYPACVATDRRQVDCLRVLLDHGAHMGMSYPESYRGSALYAAAALNVLPCARLLRVHGAKGSSSNTEA